MASHHIASGVEVDTTYDWSPTESHIFLPAAAAAAALLLTHSSMTSLESQRCVVYFISHQLNTVNVPHWAFNWDKCDFFTALYHPSSVPLFSTLKFLFIYLFGLPDTLTFQRHFWHFETTTGFCTEWPTALRRHKDEEKKCINRENPTCFHWTAVTGQNFFCTFNIFTCKSQVFEEQLTFFFFRLFFLPSVAATFILFIFFTTCSTATSLLFQALRNGIGCITIEKNIHIIYSPVCRIPFSEMLRLKKKNTKKDERKKKKQLNFVMS